MSATPRPLPLLFQWLRWRALCNAADSLRNRSVARPISIFACSALVWLFVFFLSRVGFLELVNQDVPLGGGIVGALFDNLFLAMLVMLTFSSGIILYSSLFNSHEAAFLLSSPAPADQVFAYKFQGAIGFSSWAFVLLGSPILIAFGMTYGAPYPVDFFATEFVALPAAPWYFYALLVPFFLGFIFVPGSLGALACLAVVNILPQRRKQVLQLTIVLVLAVIVLVGYRAVNIASNSDNWDRRLLDRIMSQVGVAQGTLIPSHWLARGVCAAARRNWQDALYNLGLLWSTGLVLYAFAGWAASRLYRRGYNRLATGGEKGRRHGGRWLDVVFGATLFLFDRQTRLLIIKDFRTFRRDPAQWAQIVIFCGLIALYFTNLRRFIVTDAPTFQNWLSLLNLCAVALLLCTYTGRFIYPMLSLEGRCFWILGLLPLKRGRLLWGKFAFSATGSVLIAETLILLSDVMLEMPLDAIGLHLLAVAVLALGLSGLSVGLGACLPNFKETDPSKIAVGFGGTLNLIAGLGYLALVISQMVLPWHLIEAAPPSDRRELGENMINAILIGGVVCGLILGVLAVAVPLVAGERALRRMEF